MAAKKTRTRKKSAPSAAQDRVAGVVEVRYSRVRPARAATQAGVEMRVVRLGERLNLPPQALLTQLEQLAASLPAGADNPASSLPMAEEKVLREAGSLGYDMPSLAERASTRTAVRTAQLMADALSAAEVAQRLHVTSGRIRQRISARTLFAVQTAGGWRLPRFQFSDAGVLPGLDRILAGLPADVHPLTLARFLATPSPDLLLDEEPVSPQQWLSGGGDVEPVAEVAADLHRLP